MAEPAPGENFLKFDVVIAGGGFGGAYCGKYLSKAFGSDSVKQIALISDENVLVFQPMLAEVVGASLAPLDVVTPLRIFCRRTNVLQGKIIAIDLEKRAIEIDAGRFTPNTHVFFEHLVLALGNVVDVSRVPGMAEHGYVLKNAWDALRLRVALIERMEEANLCVDAAIRRRLLSFVVVGGGYSGVETAGQILDLIENTKALYFNLREAPVRVVLVHGHRFLLPEIGEKLGRYAEKKLRVRGLEIRLETRVGSVSARGVTLATGETIEAHTVISTVGNGPHPVLTALIRKYGLTELRGRLLTEPTMQVKGHEKVWAIGDGAAIPLGSEPSTPATAQFALRQGIQVAANLAAFHQGRPLRPFRYKSQGELAAIGHRTAVANVMGVQFSGFFAWLIWRAIYLSKLPGLHRQFRVLVAWVLELFFPRDTSVLRTEPTQLIQDMHFEPGDLVVHPGDPYVSFYIVRSGRLETVLLGQPPASVQPGDYLGGPAHTQGSAWSVTATAKEPSTVVCVQSKVWETLLGATEIARRFPPPAHPGATPESRPAIERR